MGTLDFFFLGGGRASVSASTCNSHEPSKTKRDTTHNRKRNIILQEWVFTKESHPEEFHHYLKPPEGPQPKAIRRADVQFAHLQWKQFCNCTGLTNGNLNMYFLISMFWTSWMPLGQQGPRAGTWCWQCMASMRNRVDEETQ